MLVEDLGEVVVVLLPGHPDFHEVAGPVPPGNKQLRLRVDPHHSGERLSVLAVQLLEHAAQRMRDLLLRVLVVEGLPPVQEEDGLHARERPVDMLEDLLDEVHFLDLVEFVHGEVHVEESHEERVVGGHPPDVLLLEIEGLVEPMLPEVFMQEVDLPCQALREVVEHCAPDYPLRLVQDRQT